MIHRSGATTRPKTWKVLGIFFAAFSLMALAACAEEPPADPNTPWLEPGCYSSELPGVPDFQFNGKANVANNAHGFADEEGNLSEDGSCEGTATEHNAIVRAPNHDAAVAACASVGQTVSTPPQLVDYGYNVPVDAWACINQVEDPDIVEFSSNSTVTVNMAGGTEEEPTTTTVDFTGLSTGTWDPADGAFVLNQTVDDGVFFTSDGIDVAYSALQNGTTNGNFDPATGDGGFTLDVTMSLLSVLGGALQIDQPCEIGALFNFEGALDFDTGVASVTQEGFDLTAPGEGQCGALGETIAAMFEGDGVHTAEMAIQVLPAPAAD